MKRLWKGIASAKVIFGKNFEQMSILYMKDQIVETIKDIKEKYDSDYSDRLAVLADVKNAVRQMSVNILGKLEKDQFESCATGLIVLCLLHDYDAFDESDIEEMKSPVNASEVILKFMNAGVDLKNVTNVKKYVCSESLKNELSDRISEQEVARNSVQHTTYYNFDNRGDGNKILTLSVNM